MPQGKFVSIFQPLRDERLGFSGRQRVKNLAQGRCRVICNARAVIRTPDHLIASPAC
jgi:hypothetical protein